MLPDFSLLLCIVLGLASYGLAPASAGEDGTELLRAIGGTAGLTLVVSVLCRLSADRALRAVEEGVPERVVTAGWWTGLFPILGWAGAVFGFRWGTFVGGAIPPAWFMLPYVVLFLPLAVMVGAGWAAGRRIEARLDPKAPSARGAIARGLRRNAIVLVPLFLVLAMEDAVVSLAALGVPGFHRVLAWREAFPDLDPLLLVAAMTALTYFSPSLFRRALRAAPLPAGDLRDAITRLQAAIGLRCRDVLLWRTNGRVKNAMVVGLTARTRYVILTDGLLASLPVPQVVAVVAHEAGHAKRRHLPTYFVLSLALLLVLQAAQETSVPLLGNEAPLAISFVFLGLFWFGMLGWLSRRFERQADAYGADHAGALEPDAPPVSFPGIGQEVPYGAAQLMFALHRLTAGSSGRHLRHGPPSERIAFLAAYGTDPAVRDGLHRDSRRLARGIAGFVVLAVAVTALRLPAAIVRGETRLLVIDGDGHAQDARSAKARGDAAGERAAWADAKSRWLAAREKRAERPDDLEVSFLAAVGAYQAADVELRHEDPAAGPDPEGAAKRLAVARQRIEDALEFAKGSLPARTAELRFHAHVDLGRIALREGADAKKALDHLRRARAIPDSEFGGKVRRSRERLLEKAIALRDPDPEVSAAARRELERMASSAAEGPDADDLRHDASDELR